jgi:hypothetical protein
LTVVSLWFRVCHSFPVNTTSDKADGNEGVVTVRLDKATRDALQELAAENDRTLSAEVRRAIRHYLEVERVAA